MTKFAFLLASSLASGMLSAQKNDICDTIVLVSDRQILATNIQIDKTEISYEPCGDDRQGKRVIVRSFVREVRKANGKVDKNRPDGSFSPADTSELWQVVTRDGNTYLGNIVSQDAEKIVLKTATVGEISLPKAQIKSMTAVKPEEMVDGQYWYESPHNTRYFFGPTGYGLREGEGYYQNTWIFFNQVSYGLSDNFSLGLGLVPTFLFFGGDSGVPFWLTPKVSIPVDKENLSFGAGVFYLNRIGGDFSTGGAGIAYGVMTVGPRDHNFTLGLGYGFTEGYWAKHPAISFSGMHRTSRKFTLLTENYILPTGGDGTYGIISVGGRYGGRSLAVDFGLFRPISFSGDFELDFIGLPWLGINVPFGNKQSE